MLIGKPDTEEKGGKIESLLEQLRQRQLSIEQMETYERQREASEKRRELAEAQAQADMQTSLTNARVKAQIAESEGEADLQRARKQAEKQIVMAEAKLAQSRRQAEQTLVLAEADSKQAILAGRGEAQRIMQVGLSEAAVLMQKVSQLRRSAAVRPVARRRPACQEHAAAGAGAGVRGGRRRLAGGSDGNGDGHGGGGALATTGLVGLLLQTLLAERTTFAAAEPSGELAPLNELANRLTREALANMTPSQADGALPPTVTT